MKNKEFIKSVKGYGYSVVDLGVCYAVYNEFGHLLAHVSKVTRYEFDCYYKKELDRKLFCLIVDYAATPIPDREEEKKSYLRHRWLKPRLYKNYLNCIKGTNEYWLDYRNETAAVQTQFTEKEIENIKKYNNTDLSDFKIIEVEE